MKQNNTSEQLGTEPLFPLLMKMSIPSVIGMIVVSLYNIVDSMFIGQGAGPFALSALSIVFPVQLIVMAAAQMIGVGAASIISRKLGEKKEDQAAGALGTSFTAVTLLSFVVTAAVLLFSEEIMSLFGASEATMSYALTYVTYIAVGFPLLSFSMTGSTLLRAEGNAKLAMFTMVVGMILNIILDPIFIFGLGMGIKGAAIATVISQTVSAAWVFWIYYKQQSEIKITRKELIPDFTHLKEMLILGVPNFVQSAGISVLVTLVNNILLVYGGDMAIGVYGIIGRLISLVIHPIVGIAQGFQPIAGYNYGAKKFDRVKRILLISAFTSAGVASLFAILFQILPETSIRIFTDDPEMIEMGTFALRVCTSLTTLMGFQIIFSIYFQAVGKGMHALFLGLSRQFLVLVPIVLIFPRIWGVEGVWYAFPASDILSTVITTYFLYREVKHLDDKHNDSLNLKESFSQ